MKKHFRGIVSQGLNLALAAAIGCSASTSSDGTRKVKLPWPGPDGEYRLRVVEIKTLTSLPTLRGEAANIYWKPDIDSATGAFREGTPQARFEKGSDGVWIPQDALSSELAAVYAHFEKLREMDVKYGLASVLPAAPRRVALNTGMLTEDVNGQRRLLTDNAIYFGSWDALLIAPFTRTQIPISVNGGILAHEYFHSLFFHLVLKDVAASQGVEGANLMLRDHWGASKPADAQMRAVPRGRDDQSINQRHNMALLRGLNEGVADFWGWLYTRDGSFITKSLADIGGERGISAKVLSLPSEQIQQTFEKMTSPDDVMDTAYQLGHYYASLIRAVAEAEGPESAVRSVVSALNDMKLWHMRNFKTARYPLTRFAGQLLEEKGADLTKRCALVSQFAGKARGFLEFQTLCEEKGK